MPSDPRPNLAEPKPFSGTLSRGEHSLQLTINIGIDPAGEVELKFDPIALSDDTKFILLCGKSELRYKLTTPTERPVLRMRLKGFENFGSLHDECRLGRLVMSGQHSVDDKNAVTGSVVVESISVPDDVAVWRADTEKLLEHIRRIMSLAASSLLRAPIFEFFCGDDVEVVMWSQIRQESSAFRVVHFLAQEAIFEAAIKSFFDPPVVVKNLFFAIEWFGMDAEYSEVRLVAAMTALENLIDANSLDEEALIQPRRDFEKTRRTLRKVIRACLKQWPPSDGEGLLEELNEKLADVNRRPLLAKLDLLAKRWGVPLEDISQKSLRAAKNARDRIVHRGHYYEDAKDSDADLWTHVVVVREIAVRFLLTAIGYKGRYISYLGGYHDADFPPLSPDG